MAVMLEFLDARATSADVPNKGPIFTTVGIAMFTVAALLVIFRCGWVFAKTRSLGWSDISCICALFCDLTILVIGIKSVGYGMGRHKVDIPKSGGDLTEALKLFYFFQIFYKLAILFNKLSFLFLYHHVFATRSFQITTIVVMALVISASIAFIFATTFECTPISKNWNKKSPGHCINNQAFRWSWAGWNTASDVFICLMPIPVIRMLNMDRMKKIGVAFIFALGLFVCVTSVIRMFAMVTSVSTKDTTWGSFSAYVWSDVEANTGLICTCLPFLKQPIAQLFPSLFSSIHKSSKRTRSNTYTMNKLTSHGASRIDTDDELKWKSDVRAKIGEVTTTVGTDTSGRESQEGINTANGYGITMRTDVSLSSDIASLSDHERKKAESTI